MEVTIAFSFLCAAILYFDINALPYFKQKNPSFPTKESMQWRHEIQDGGTQEI